MKYNHLHFLAFISVFFAFQNVKSQNNYMKFGYLHTQFKSSTGWKNNNWPGFQISLAGITATQYSGNNERIKEDTFHRGYKSGGRYWDIGYTFAKNLAGPLDYSCGISFGGMRLHGSSGNHFTIRPGIAMNIIGKLGFYADLQLGYTMMNKDTLVPYMLPVYYGAEKAFRHFFYAPSFGIRFVHSISEVRGKENVSSKSRLGIGYSYDHTDGVYDYYSSYDYVNQVSLPSAENYFNFYTKLFLPRPDDYSNLTRAGAIGIALRAGILALDLEHAQGNLGYSYDNLVGERRYMQNYWNFHYNSIGIGFNIINIIQPFDKPTLYRAIIGYRMGWASFKSNYDAWTQKYGYAYGIQAQNINNQKFGHWYYSFEIGRFAVSLENYDLKPEKLYRSRVFAASYFFPIDSPD